MCTDYLRDSESHDRKKVLEDVENELLLDRGNKGPGAVFGKEAHLTGLDSLDAINEDIRYFWVCRGRTGWKDGKA